MKGNTIYNVNGRYCRICQHHVPGKDHHCVWVDACISRRNFYPFVIFLACIFFTLVHQTALPDDLPGDLLVGYGAGSLVLEPARIRAVLDAIQQGTSEEHCVYGVFPDALVVTTRPLSDPERRRVRAMAREIVQDAFPDRAWLLGISRKMTLDVPPIGRVELVTPS